MLEINIADEARMFLSALRALPVKHADQIVAKIDLLATNPNPPRSKLLEGFAPLRRLQSGYYRIVYFVDGDILKVVLIDRRNDDKIYRRLKQIFG